MEDARQIMSEENQKNDKIEVHTQLKEEDERTLEEQRNEERKGQKDKQE